MVNTHPNFEPLPEEPILESLTAWPEAALVRVCQEAAAELSRRHCPLPVAAPLVEVVFGSMQPSAPSLD